MGRGRAARHGQPRHRGRGSLRARRPLALAHRGPAAHPRAALRLSVFGLLALGIAGVALGIARRALDELVALAGGKTPTGSRRFLAERPVIHAEVARAEATLGAARAFLAETVGAAWERAQAAGAIEVRERARLRLAATHATLASARAVDLMYGAGGGTAVYAASPLQRCFRDIHVATQHMMVAPATLELAGRILLGLEADSAML